MADAIAGELTIAEDVITDLAGYAALESYGIVGMAAPTLSDGIASCCPRVACVAVSTSRGPMMPSTSTCTSSSSTGPISPR